MSQNVYTLVTQCIFNIHYRYTLGYTCIYIGLHTHIHYITFHVTECICHRMYIRQIVTQCIYQMYIKCCTMYIGVYTSGPRGLYITVHSIYITVFLDIRPRCRLSNAITVHANIHYSACQYIGYIHWVTFPPCLYTLRCISTEYTLGNNTVMYIRCYRMYIIYITDIHSVVLGFTDGVSKKTPQDLQKTSLS